MRIRRTGAGALAWVAVGCLALGCPQAARAQVKLEFKFPEGQRLSYKTTMKMHQVLTINGQEVPTEVDETIVASQTVGKRRGDSSLPVTSKVESLRVDLTTAVGNITFDSKDPDAKLENAQLAF